MTKPILLGKRGRGRFRSAAIDGVVAGRNVVDLDKPFAMNVVRAHDIHLYIDILVALLLMAGSAYALFRVFNRHNIVDFMIATEAEMKKVNWPSKKEVIGSTWIVICGTLMLALLMFVADFLFIWLFTKIEILNTGAAAATAASN